MLKKKIKDAVAGLMFAFKSHNDPHEIASGVAIGCFIAILPLYGLHTVLCVLAMIIIPKVNKLSILLGTNVSLPPTLPTITWASYDMGRLLLGHEHYAPLSWEYIKTFNMSKIGEFYYPLFMGSLVLGFLCAVILYFITWGLASHFRRVRLPEHGNGGPSQGSFQGR